VCLTVQHSGRHALAQCCGRGTAKTTATNLRAGAEQGPRADRERRQRATRRRLASLAGIGKANGRSRAVGLSRVAQVVDGMHTGSSGTQKGGEHTWTLGGADVDCFRPARRERRQVVFIRHLQVRRCPRRAAAIKSTWSPRFAEAEPCARHQTAGPPWPWPCPPRARPSQRPDHERQTHALAERCATDLVRATNSALGAARLLGEGMAAWCGVRLAHDGQPTTTVGGAANQAAGPPSVRPVRRLPPFKCSRPLLQDSIHAAAARWGPASSPAWIYSLLIVFTNPAPRNMRNNDCRLLCSLSTCPRALTVCCSTTRFPADDPFPARRCLTMQPRPQSSPAAKSPYLDMPALAIPHSAGTLL
jgi:hypothetical protein